MKVSLLVSVESTLAGWVWASSVGAGTGVLVGDGWAVSVLVSLVVHNLTGKRTV